MLRPEPLSPDLLTHPYDQNTLDFETTADIPALNKVLGQPRALRALEMGSEVTGPGFNIFVSGLPDSGRNTLTLDYIKQKAETQPVPDDWCYVNNFNNPYQPRVISLPAGQATILKDHIDSLIERCQDEIKGAFHSEEYINERNRLTKSMQENQEDKFQKLQNEANKLNFTIVRSSSGFGLVPMVNGKPLTPEELEKLSDDNRKKFKGLQGKLEQKALEAIVKIQQIGEEYYQKMQKLDRYTVLFAIKHLFDSIKAGYEGLSDVIDHIDSIQDDIIENAGKLREDDKRTTETQWLEKYRVNILVDNSKQKGAPVVVENHPTYHNLVGRIEHRLVMGVSQTDFSMIRPGALHRANGGYLLLPAREVLLSPYAWQGLERALRDGEIRIIELGSQLGLISTTSLEPAPIPLTTKVILFGTPVLYELLRLHDVDFSKLFKVRAEFATFMDRDAENGADYALFIKSVVEANNLPVFDRTAVARIIEHSSRMAGDQHKLSTRFGQIADLAREAAFWSQKDAQQVVTSSDVERAIQEADYRDNLSEELVQDWIQQDTILIDVSDEKVGQVNALSVMSVGDFSFGRPSRVTASVYPGSGGVVDIEKQAELGGPIHTKGVLIISGLLGRRYGQKRSLNLTANLTFEQSYHGVEGDSASTAEICALLSAIAEVPLRQDRAMTGSINQLGEIQAVGGVNEKIEGFFRTCKHKGLNGSQGVIIPSHNARNLMLKAEVVEAVKQGQFQIWTVHTLDEALSLLTDLDIGILQEDGTYPEGTFNFRVGKRLDEFTELSKADQEH